MARKEIISSSHSAAFLVDFHHAAKTYRCSTWGLAIGIITASFHFALAEITVSASRQVFKNVPLLVKWCCRLESCAAKGMYCFFFLTRALPVTSSSV